MPFYMSQILQNNQFLYTTMCVKFKLSGGNLSNNHIQEVTWRHFRVLTDSEVRLGASHAKKKLEALNARASDGYLRLCGVLW